MRPNSTPLTIGQRVNPYGKIKNPLYVSPAILRTPQLTLGEKVTWTVLCKSCGPDGNCYPSFTSIAKQLGISRGGAIKCVHGLIEKGFLEKCESKTKSCPQVRSNQYFLLLHPILEKAFDHTDQKAECNGNPPISSSLEK